MSFDPKAPLTAETIAAAAELEIFDVDGKKVRFGSVFEEQKTFVVFIRHFFCGVCHAYVENLALVPQASLDAAGTRIVVIGCGEYQPIKTYQETTGFRGPIYADPSRKLYHKLGMTLETLKGTPQDQARPEYLRGVSRLSNALTSIGRALTTFSFIGKQGNMSQLGGEFIFGPGNQCAFTARMRNTEDHISVEELMKEGGVDFKEPIP